MSARDDKIAELEAAHDRFRATFASLPEEAYSEKWLGAWDLDHLLAHMAGWWREMTPAFARVGAGERPTPDGVDYSDADSWNAKFAADPLHGHAALAEWDDAYRAYRDAASATPEDFFGIDAQKGRPRIGDRLLTGAGIHHFEEHQDELASWIAARS